PMTPRHAIQWIWAAWWTSWMLAAFFRNRTVARPSRSSVGYRSLNVLGAILIFALFARRWGPRLPTWSVIPTIGWALAAVTAIGFAFCWWARIHLGRLWSAGVVRREGHRVVDSGPYRLVRHPIYTGICLAAFATAIIEGATIALVGAAVLTYGFYI